ncbi:MAG: hypothetical protein VB119_07105 [Candidatus Metalachnospira sp.]|nr:hypothetical protein [Candidatus Metalachnospira sp.]
MGREKNEEIARREGMAYALKIAQEKGVDGLIEELKFRNVTQIPVAISRGACDLCITKIKENTIDTVLVLMAATLHDEFGFGEKRVQQAINRFEEKAECLTENYCTWEDHIRMIKDEMGIELRIRMFDENIEA